MVPGKWERKKIGRKNERKEKAKKRNINFFSCLVILEISREKKRNFFTETVAGARKGQPLGNSAGGDDEGIGQDGLEIGEDFEGSGGKIDLGDSCNEDLGAEAEGLGATAIHDFIIVNTIRETGEVLNVGGGGELAVWSNVVGHPAFEEDGTELGSGSIDGGGVGCRTVVNDAETGVEGFKNVHEPSIKFPFLFL